MGLRFNPICRKGHLTMGSNLSPQIGKSSHLKVHLQRHVKWVQTWAPNRQILSLEGPSQKTCQILLHVISTWNWLLNLFCKCIIQCFFAHELWPCASKWIELCKPSSVHYLLRKWARFFSISKMLNTPYQSSVPTLGFTCLFAHLLWPCTLPLWFWQKGDLSLRGQPTYVKD